MSILVGRYPLTVVTTWTIWYIYWVVINGGEAYVVDTYLTQALLVLQWLLLLGWRTPSDSRAHNGLQGRERMVAMNLGGRCSGGEDGG